MSRLNCVIEISEDDIKLAIAKYIAEVYGLSIFLSEPANIKLEHHTQTNARWPIDLESTSETIYSAVARTPL